MKTEVINQLRFAASALMRLTVSLLCALFLMLAYFLKTPFLIQAIIFAFSLANMFATLKDGFNSLCDFSVGANSLVFMCALSALLQGAVGFGQRNCFAYTAFVFSMFVLGEYLEEREFGKVVKNQSCLKKICRVWAVLSLVIFVFAITLNLVFGEGMYSAMSNAFCACVYFCPVAALLAEPLVTVLYCRKASENGIFIGTSNALFKLGYQKDIIFDTEGIVCEEEYSLNDVYSAEGDKESLICAAAAIEEKFSHQFSKALSDAAKKLELKFENAEECFEICGRGVCGKYNGDKYFLGNKKLFKEKRIKIPDMILKIDFSENTPVFVAKNRKFAGVLLFFKRRCDNVDFFAEKIREMDKRCILLANERHAPSKGNFDILLSRREKVLQEFKNGVKIKAVIISQKPLAKADVTVTVFPSGNSDVVLGNRVFENAYFALKLGKSALKKLHSVLFLTLPISAFVALLSAFGYSFSPFLAVLVTLAPIALVFFGARFEAPIITTSEDDEMFGKVNYTMHIDGMNCAHCSARVKTALESIKGVSAKISLEEKIARIKCPSKLAADELSKAVSDLGFTVTAVERV